MMATAEVQIGPAIAVYIPSCHAKAGELRRQAGGLADIFEFESAQIVVQSRAALAPLKEAFADDQIKQAIAVVVRHRHAAGGDAGRAAVGFLGDIGELPAPFVAEQV